MKHVKSVGMWRGILIAMALAFQPCVAAELSAAGSDSYSTSRWVATWTSAQMAPVPTISSIFFEDRRRSFENQTIRHIVHTSVGGKRVRVRFSNAFGTVPLHIGAAYVALRSSQAAIHPSSNRRLTFSGQPSILVPPGAVAVSDAADLDVPTAGDLAVSAYLPAATELATFHEMTNQTHYIAGPGNFANAIDLPGAEMTLSTYYLAAVEVLSSERIGTLVALGDSITQGEGSSLDANGTWPERLSARLNPPHARPRLAVVNHGIGCGRLLYDFCGPGGAARFDRDVLAVTGATHVIVALGLNDITIPSILPNFGLPEFAGQAVSATDITTGLHQLIQRARAQGVKIYGATITPIGSSAVPGAFTPENEAKRQAVNRWIRTSGAFDGVIDFDAAVRDPDDPSRLRSIYDFDGIHITDLGYQAMANAINLSLLF